LEAIEWIRRNKSNPFFLWIHYMDVHNPYLVGEDLKRIKKLSYFVREQELVRKSHEAYVKGERVEKGEVYRRMMEEIIKIYDRRITAVGNCIGKLILELRREGLDKGTALILTSDHGQGFLEHGLYSHGPYFYEEFLRVPMILGFLKGEGGSRE
jgi:membrane-anchored protein YejM (alkaline phosphatase superfamily)